MSEENVTPLAPPRRVRRNISRTALLMQEQAQKTGQIAVENKEEFFFQQEIDKINKRIDLLETHFAILEPFKQDIGQINEDLTNLFEVVDKQEQAVLELQDLIKLALKGK